MKNPIHIISPTSSAGPTTRLWIYFSDSAPEDSGLPGAESVGRSLVAQWPPGEFVDVKAALKRLHREVEVLFAYEQPAEPAEKRRRPPAKRTASALAGLELPHWSSLEAAMLADLGMELNDLLPEALQAAAQPGWRLLASWPDVAPMSDVLGEMRCGKEEALNRMLHFGIEQGETFPALDLLELSSVDPGDLNQRAVLNAAALGFRHSSAPSYLAAALSSGNVRSWELEKVAFGHLEARRFQSALAIFDAVIELYCTTDPDPTGLFRHEGVRSWADRKDRHLMQVLNNALWVIQKDNSGLKVEPEKVKRYLMAALPYGPWNPAIYYNGACVLVEQGQLPSAVACIVEAVRHRYRNVDDLRKEPLFEVLQGREDFEAAFHAAPIVDWAAEAAAERKRRRTQAASVFEEKGKELSQSPEAATLLGLVKYLKDDEELQARVQERLHNPPRTVEEIGFYLGANDNPFERTFRYAVSQLDQAGSLMACEDKYSPELFELFRRHIELPERAGTIISPSLAPEDYLPLFREIEARFARAGTPLCTLWTGGGDHLYFAAVLADGLDRWLNRVIGHTHAGEPLGLCQPRWDVLFDHLGYAFRWPLERTLVGWKPVKWKSDVAS